MCIALKHYCRQATTRLTMTMLTVAHHSFSPAPTATIKSCRSYSLWALISPTGKVGSRIDPVWKTSLIKRFLYLSQHFLLFCSRDDEHRTALMLAAEEGHTLVMKILLDNHAPVNELDKLKVRCILTASVCSWVLTLSNLPNYNSANLPSLPVLNLVD